MTWVAAGGAAVVGGLAAASLLWPGGDGPGACLPPEQLGAVLPAAWLAFMVAAPGRAGAPAATLLALPALLAAALLSPAGWWAVPGAIACALAGGWWRHGAGRPPGGATPAHHFALTGALALLALPPLLSALWSAVGLGGGPLPAGVSPVGADAPGVGAVVPLVGLATLCWWRARGGAA